MVAGSGKLHQGTWGFFIRKGHVPSFWHCNSLKTQSFYLKKPLASQSTFPVRTAYRWIFLWISHSCEILPVRYHGIRYHSVCTLMCLGHKHSSLSGPTSITENSRGQNALLENTTLNIRACSSASLETFVIKSELWNPLSLIRNPKENDIAKNNF